MQRFSQKLEILIKFKNTTNEQYSKISESLVCYFGKEKRNKFGIKVKLVLYKVRHSSLIRYVKNSLDIPS